MRKLTADRARQVLAYDPETGQLTWKQTLSNRALAGSVAGNVSVADGYVQIRVDGQIYRGHRLAWLIVTGDWPRQVIDHINGVRSDNRWANLRDTSQSVNSRNSLKVRPNSASGLLGVSFRSDNGKPFAQIMVNGRNVNLGTFATPELAHAAYMAAKDVYHAGCYFADQGDKARQAAQGRAVG